MSKKSNTRTLGIIGGVLIAIAALLTGTGFDFSTDGLGHPTTLVLFAAGLGVIFFLLAGKMPWAIYSTIAAATIGLIWILGVIMDGADISLQLILLVIGVILALLATTWHHRG
jgi:hypothetical protein